MFLKNSRYYGLETVEAKDRCGRAVAAVKLRKPDAPSGEDTTVTQGDQLDVMSQRKHKDATKYWHIADANTEVEANELVRIAGRVIKVPKS
jgi:hypothetical protein